MTDELAEQEAFVLRAKRAQERANILARNIREFREAEAKMRAEEPDLADKAKAAGLLLADSMDKAQDAHLDHATHAMVCRECDILYKRIARLERKAKKWKRRAKKAEAFTYSKANLDAGFKHHITETPWEPEPSHSREALAFAEAQVPELTHRTYWIDNGSRGSLLGPWVCMCGKTGETIETKAAHELATA